MSAILSLVLLSLAVAYAVLRDGAVELHDWQTTLIGIAIAGFSFWAVNRPDATQNRNHPNLIYYLLAAMLGLAILQIVPLPVGLVSLLSPQRAAEAQSLLPFLGSAPGFATLSAVPLATREKVVTLFSYVLVYLLVRQLAGKFKDALWIPVFPLVIVGTMEGALGVFQASSGLEISSGTFVNRNHYAGLLEMCLPLTVMVGVNMLSRNQDRFSSPLKPALLSCLFFGASAIMMLGIVRSSSRMGFIAAILSLFVMATTAIVVSSRGSGKLRLIPVAVLALFFAAAFILLPTDRLAERFASMASSDDKEDADSRLEYWRQTVPLVKAYPVSGCGLGAYESCFMPYKAVAAEQTVDYAHNDYMQILAEFGFTGFAVVIAILLLIYTRAFHNYSVGKADSAIALGCVGALTAIMMHSTADFNLYIPANGLVVAWVAGLVRDA